MTTLFRRDVLKGLVAASVGGVLPIPGLRSLAFGAEPGRAPILVVLHLRGGCDGLNLVSPASDPDFIAARIGDLRVAMDGKDAGYALAGGPDPKIDFRLHPAAGGLAELYQNRALAIVHASGLTNKTRSHFVATDMMDRGVTSDPDLAHIPSGWLSRAVAAKSRFAAMTAQGTLSGDLADMTNAMAIPDLAGGLPPVGGPAVSSALWQLYRNSAGAMASAGRDCLQMMAEIDPKVPRDPQGRIAAYQPDGGASYDTAADFARPLKTVAQLIKMDMGLQVATLEYGNWDTHEYQAGRFRYQVERLSNGLAAFWTDMAAYHDRLVVVTATEFGRRLRNNKSNGTDHGRAGVTLVLSGKGTGGKFYGPWPGLKTEQLDEGVDLAVATDYRRILTEIVNAHLGVPGSAWFPGYAYPGKLGLMV